MASFFKDNPDLQFYFEQAIDWQRLVTLVERDQLGAEPAADDGFRNVEEAVEFYRDIVEMVGEFVVAEIVPHVRTIDDNGPQLVDGEAVFPRAHDAIFAKLRELELYGMCLPRELGGMNVPMIVHLIIIEMMARADVSIMSHYGFHGGIALAMLMLSIVEGSTEVDDQQRIAATRFADEIAEVISGRAWGCMDITEPDAGSDMSALRSVGVQDEHGNWFLTGQKIFITSGHGKYHFVIARTEGPDSGLDGLSMFLVPTYGEDESGQRVRPHTTLDRVEEKLGHHGSATVSITFERTPAHLIGKRGEGFRYMLYLMNTARVSVGFEALGLCEATYRMARDYAAQRPSMGKTIDRHEMIADYLDEMEIDIIGLRALAMHCAFHEEVGQYSDILVRLGAASDQLRAQREGKRHRAKSRRSTPLLKYLGAEKAIDMARRCVQIHGGNGYMREYGAEKLLRDAMVMPIYEGTSQIQALMAMKDTLGAIIKNPQEFVKRIAQTRWRTLSARDPLERRVARIQQLSLAAQQHLITRTAANKLRSLSGTPLPEWPRAFMANWDPKRDFSFAMLHAERLTRLLADELICEVLWKQAVAHPQRRAYLARYLDRAEPRARFLHDEITTTGLRLLDKLAASESQSGERAG